MAQSSSQDFCMSLSDLAHFMGLTPAQVKDEIKKVTGQSLHSIWVLPEVVRQILENRGYQYGRKTISVQMLKGGVAKTTSVLNMGLRAAMYGARVLFVDLDQQANLSYALGVEAEDEPVWIDVVEKKVAIADAIVSIGDQIDLIPSSLNNSVLDRVLLNSNRNWAMAVKGPLEWVKTKYDLILIDTAPAVSAVNTAATVASDEVILPVTPDKFAISGLEKHLAELAAIRADFQLQFEEKILFTKFDSRERASHEILQKCMDSFADKLMKSYIRTSSDVKNTVATHRTIFHQKSAAKEDYDLATREIMGWG